MNKYVVAFSSESGNGIEQGLVEASSKRSAVLKYLAQFQDINFEEDELLNMEDTEALIDDCYNYAGVMVAVIEV